MNFAKPILICDENEAFRDLIREMLTKNGFFHIVEATNTTEAMKFMNEKREYFIIIHPSLISSELIQLLAGHNHFLVMANNNEESTVKLAATLGVEHMLTFPVHSKKLVDKISSLL